MRQQHRPRRVTAVGIVLLAVGVIAADVAVLTLRDRATPLTLNQALHRYRGNHGAGTAHLGSNATPSGTSQTVALDPVIGATTLTSAPSSSSPGGAASPAPLADLRPPAGVYRYRTVGHEEIPFVNASRRYPPQTTATVVRGRGCGWHFEVDLLAEHADRYDLCTSADGLGLSRFSITIEWFLIRQTIAFDCARPVPLLDTSGTRTSKRRGLCTNPDGRVTMDITDLPMEELQVGSTRVRTARIELVMTIAGTFEGTSVSSVWLDPTSGLILKMHRTVDAQGATPIGRQRYVEEHTTALADLRPAT